MVSARARSSRVFVSIATTLSALAALVVSTALPTLQADAHGSFGWNHAERCFMKKINKVRARHGLSSLSKDAQLGYVAKRHARAMARKGSMWEQQNLGSKVTRWRTLAQNTGRGSKCRRLFRAFMASSPHAANILGSYRFVGVGATWRHHRLYVQQIFESKRNPGNVYHTP